MYQPDTIRLNRKTWLSQASLVSEEAATNWSRSIIRGCSFWLSLYLANKQRTIIAISSRLKAPRSDLNMPCYTIRADR